MNKTQALQYIINAMSLRTPQEKSLVLFADYLESNAGKKVLARMKRENRRNVNDIEVMTKEYAKRSQSYVNFRRLNGLSQPILSRLQPALERHVSWVLLWRIYILSMKYSILC